MPALITDSASSHRRRGLWAWVWRTILRIDPDGSALQGLRRGMERADRRAAERAVGADAESQLPPMVGLRDLRRAAVDDKDDRASASLADFDVDAVAADDNSPGDRDPTHSAEMIDPEQWFTDDEPRRKRSASAVKSRDASSRVNSEAMRGLRFVGDGRSFGGGWKTDSSAVATIEVEPPIDGLSLPVAPIEIQDIQENGDASVAVEVNSNDDPDEQAQQPAGAVLRTPREHQAGAVLPSVRQGLCEVPPLPHVVRELLKELSDPASTARSVARIATTDPTLAASLIRTVNSASMGLRRKINSVAEAVSYLGYSIVRSLVIRMRLEQILPTRGQQAGYDAEDLWIHSLAVSYAADCLAQRVPGLDHGLVSTLGLLHDIGKLAINSQFPDSAAELKRLSLEHADESFLDRERRVLGADHAEIGAVLADHWKLPPELIQAIRWHHAPLSAPQTLPPEVRSATAVVHLANQLAKYCYVYSEDMEIDIVGDDLFRTLGIPGPLTRLLTSSVRLAISRAIFVADESSTRPLRAVRRFVRFSDLKTIKRILKSPPKPTRAVSRIILATASEELFPETACARWSSLRNASGNDAALATNGMVRFIGQTSPLSVEATAQAVTKHQDALRLDDDVRMPARFLIRRLLPNLLEASDGHHSIEIVQWKQDDRLALVVRCPVLDFARRFGRAVPTQSAIGVLSQDLANVLNLRWFADIRTSRDGSVLRFVTHANRR